MDLGTMEAKIKEHGYSTVQQFRDDLQLVSNVISMKYMLV